MNDARNITSQLGDLRGSEDSPIRDPGPGLPGTRVGLPHGDYDAQPLVHTDPPVADTGDTPTAMVVTTDADDQVTDVSTAEWYAENTYTDGDDPA